MIRGAVMLSIASGIALGAAMDAGQGGLPEVWRDLVQPYRGPVDAPDTMGGWSSSNVILRLMPGAGVDEATAELSALIPGLVPERILPAFMLAPPRNPELAQRFGLDRYYTLHVPEWTDASSLVSAIGALAAADGSTIEIAELNGIGGILSTFPNDPSFNLQYALHNTGQTIEGQPGVPGADIDAVLAWDHSTGSSDVILAIIDTGVSYSHPDLTPNRIGGWNAFDGSNNADDSWLIPHGTHCAGIAGARGDNGIGVAGVNWVVSLMPVKVLDLFGSGTEQGVASGIIWAADNGAHVASLSLGFPGRSNIVDNAVAYAHAAGVLVVAASGNTPGGTIGSPAAAPDCMAVGATNNRDQIASFTTTGPEMSVTAPGVSVYSTWDSLFNPNSYTFLDGTSMACPHVAGLGALLLSVNPDLTNVELRQIIESTADDLGDPGWDPIFGHGRINAHNAVLAALGGGCAADLNGDGELDADDFFLFLDWFAAGDARADLNGDGEIDADDFFAYLDLFAAGCD